MTGGPEDVLSDAGTAFAGVALFPWRKEITENP
jgi:hypothetical protein